MANDADGLNTAGKLQVTIDEAVGSVNSGSLGLQVVSETTTLASLNNGKGVRSGSFLITDTNGVSAAINLSVNPVETLGDLVDQINALGVGVEARFNTSGDGLLLVDTLNGSGTLSVTDTSGTTATELKIAGTAKMVTLDGRPTQAIDGATTVTVNIGANDTLQDLINSINALDAGVVASAFDDGSSATPHRLALVSRQSGKAGELLLDASQFGLSFQEVTSAQDALLLTGSADSLGAGILATSSLNSFDSALPGVQLNVNGSTSESVTISVAETDDEFVSNIRLLVDQYNKLEEKLGELTAFNETDNTSGPLFGTSEALRVESDITRLLTGKFFGVGSIRSLAQLGIQINGETGKLELDEEKLSAAYAADPDAVQQFFTTDEIGFAVKLSNVIDTLAGEESSLLINRNDALQRRIDVNAERIELMSERLDRQRERLLKQFYNLENVIARMQNDLQALTNIQRIPPATSRSSLAG